MIKTLIVSFLGVSRTGFLSFAKPSLILRSSFAEPSLEQKINKGCTMGFISYLCG